MPKKLPPIPQLVTMKDVYALGAMIGIISRGEHLTEDIHIAVRSYDIADAMYKEKLKREYYVNHPKS